MTRSHLAHWNGKKPIGPQFSVTEYSQRWRVKNPASYLYTVAKRRAKIKHIDFNITKEDIIVPTHCPILNIPLMLNMDGTMGGKYNSYSLDRIDPTKGYIKNNIQVISHLANTMKSYATKEQLILFANWILQEYRD